MAWTGSVVRCGVLVAVLVPAAASALEPAGGGPLPIVPPGTPVGDTTAARWNRLLLAAVPRIASGDTGSIPATVRERLGQWPLVLLATVRKVDGADGRPSHRLDEVGAGYAAAVGGRFEVVDTENPPPAANVDFLGRQVLSQNGRALVGLHRVGGSETVLVFDAESFLVRDGHHGDFLMRHFVWVDPASGECSMCVWLLVKRPDGGLAVVDEPPRWLAGGTREDRAIHVDGNEFLLGIPTRRAFALLDMPPGLPLAWSPALRGLAAEPACPPATVHALATELDRCLQPLRAGPHPAVR
jgi:hypothetical protein